LEEVDHHAGCVEAEGLLDRLFDHAAKQCPRQRPPVHVGHVGAEHQSRLCLARYSLENLGLPDGQLDGIRTGAYQGLHGFFKIFDAVEKSWFISWFESGVHLGEPQNLRRYS
jgi:hypothetical protein